MAEGWVDTPYLEELTAHVEKCVGPVEPVLHEIVSDVVHVDVLVIKPSEARPYFTLVTAGMSSLPMKVPKEMGNFRFTELVMTLPATNSYLSGGDGTKDNVDPPDYYSISDLTRFARYPHQAETWLGPGHTLAGSDPPRILGPDTKMTGYILDFPFAFPSHDCWSFVAKDGNKVSLLQMYAIYTDELLFKNRSTSEALIEKMNIAGALGPYNPARPSVVKRKKLFGLF